MTTPAPTPSTARENTPQYRADYIRGWKAGVNIGALDRADDRNEPDAWYDGYLDYAAGREKWHRRDCAAHHNRPGGCGVA